MVGASGFKPPASWSRIGRIVVHKRSDNRTKADEPECPHGSADGGVGRQVGAGDTIEIFGGPPLRASLEPDILNSLLNHRRFN
jgi:hypothetical protein